MCLRQVKASSSSIESSSNKNTNEIVTRVSKLGNETALTLIHAIKLLLFITSIGGIAFISSQFKVLDQPIFPGIKGATLVWVGLTRRCQTSPTKFAGDKRCSLFVRSSMTKKKS